MVRLPDFSASAKQCFRIRSAFRFLRALLSVALTALLLAFIPPLKTAAVLPSSPMLAAANATSPLGTNTDFFRYYSSDWVFVDAFKQSRQWLTQCTPSQGQADCNFGNSFDTHEEASLIKDADGWIISLPKPGDAPIYWIAGTTLFNGLSTHYPSGQYIVLYDGAGTIVYTGDAIKNNSLSTLHRDVLDVTPTNAGITIQITATDPSAIGDYLRNIRIIMPGYESTYASQIFHPTYLSRIAKYKLLRFKDWLETDASTQKDWVTRTLPTNARWDTPSGAGIPVEILMSLANRNQSDAWVNMPHMATDDYITQFATLVKNTLASNLKVYVEYSNEIWNDAAGFPQGAWVQSQAVLKWTGSESGFTKRMNWHGMRTAQMCDIWKQVFVGQSNRVICVLGAQSGNSFTASQALDCPLWTDPGGKPCSAHGIDAVAIGPYFAGYLGNQTFEPQVQTWTSDPDGGLGKLFQEINQGGVVTGGPTGGALQRVRDEVANTVNVASARSLYVVAYEGGSHLHDTLNNTAVIALFNNANHDSRMGAVYDRYLADWKTAAGATGATRVFVHFKNVSVPISYGAFGALDYVDQTSSPKYDALMRFIDGTPCWWNGCVSTNSNLYLPLVTR